jgi:hypothetical protein
MVFTKRLREGIRRGRIKCSIRIWMRPQVKAGGRYLMDDGHVVVDSITRIRLKDITSDLAQESGFSSVKDLLDSTTCLRVAGMCNQSNRFLVVAPADRDDTAPPD